MMCDVLIAADTAKFGQPEIKLGVLPGMGGSQRLTRAIGKAKAMDLILTGRTIDAAEAERSGLVSRVVPADELLDEAKAVATTISQMSRSAARMAKEAVNRAFESTLTEGLLYERRLFHSAFATDDQTEGMAAFTEKRACQLHPPIRFTRVSDVELETAPTARTDERKRDWWQRRYTFTGTAVGLVFLLAVDDAVAAAARPAVPGPGQRRRRRHRLRASACSRCGWCGSCSPGPAARPPPRWAWPVLVVVGAHRPGVRRSSTSTSGRTTSAT